MQNIPPQSSTEENGILLFPSDSLAFERKGCTEFSRNRSRNPIAIPRHHLTTIVYGLPLIRLSSLILLLLKLNSDLLSMSEWETLLVAQLSPRVIVRIMTRLNIILTAVLHVLMSGTCRAGGRIRAEGGINLLPQQTFVAQHHRVIAPIVFIVPQQAKDQQYKSSAIL